MNKNQFLSELSYQLRRLPEEERNEAVRYYDEYISDAEDEAAAISGLGAPGYVAAVIIAEWAGDLPAVIEERGTGGEEQSGSESSGSAGGYGSSGSYGGYEKKKSGAFKTFWVVLLAVFASPIALPIACAIFAVAFALIVSLFAIFVSIAVGGIGAVVGGIFAMIMGFGVIAQSGWAFLLLIGEGFVGVGAGILLVMFSVFIAKHGVGGLVKWLSGLIRRRGRK